jgi:hypothetical protein
MNLTNPESHLFTEAKRGLSMPKAETPFSESVEVVGKTIQTNDIINITKRNDNAVQYRVTGITLDDKKPARLTLEPLHGGIKKHISLDTLAKKPDSFRVLSKAERTKLAEAEITNMRNKSVLRDTAKGLTDDVIDRAFDEMQQPSEAQRIAMAEAEIAAIRAARETKASTPIAQVQKELDNYVSLREQLRVQEENHIEEMRTKIANMLSTTDAELKRSGFTQINTADKRTLNPNIPFPPRPKTFEAPTLQSIRETVAGTNTTLYETAPDDVARARRNINTFRQGDQQQITVSSTEFSTRLAADTAARNAQKVQTSPSLFGKITSGIRSFFGRKEEPQIRSGATLPRTTYEVPSTLPTETNPEPPNSTVFPDNVIDIRTRRTPPTKRSTEDSGLLDAAE